MIMIRHSRNRVLIGANMNEEQKEILDDIVSRGLAQSELVTHIDAETGCRTQKVERITPNSLVKYVTENIKEKLGSNISNECYVHWKNDGGLYLYVDHKSTRHSFNMTEFYRKRF